MRGEQREAAQRDHGEGADEDRLVQRQILEGQAAEDRFYEIKMIEHGGFTQDFGLRARSAQEGCRGWDRRERRTPQAGAHQRRQVGRHRQRPRRFRQGSLHQGLLLPRQCARLAGVAGADDKARFGSEHRAAAGELVVSERQRVPDAGKAHPAAASIAIMSLRHILPVSTHMLSTARNRSWSTDAKWRTGSLWLGCSSERYSLRPSAMPFAFAPAIHSSKPLRARRVKDEVHAGKSRAAVIGGEAAIVAPLVDHRMQPAFHAWHGVDLAGHAPGCRTSSSPTRP